MPNLPSFTTSHIDLNEGSFPPPALPGFLSTTSPTDSPPRPVWPSQASGWSLAQDHAMGSPVLPQFSLCTCRRHYPGGAAGCLSLPSPAVAAFPVKSSGQPPHCYFRGLLSVYSSYSPHTRGVTNDPFHRRLQTGRRLPACSDCYRLERPLPGGTCTLSRTVPFHGTRLHHHYARA